MSKQWRKPVFLTYCLMWFEENLKTVSNQQLIGVTVTASQIGKTVQTVNRAFQQNRGNRGFLEPPRILKEHCG